MPSYLQRVTDFNTPEFVNFFDELPLWSARFGQMLFQNIILLKGIKGLDVGCGTGFPLFELAQMHDSSCEFVGIDIWQPALERAEKRRQYHNLQNVKLLLSEPARFPLPDGDFDLIVSNLGINNFDNSPAVLAECFRVSKPGARLILTTNLYGHMREFYGVYRAVLHDFGNPDYLERLQAHEAHRSTRESLRQLLEANGFMVAKMVQAHFQMRFLNGSALLNHRFIGIGFLPAWRAIITPQDEVVVFTALEKALNQAAHAAGDLSLTIPMLYVESIRG